MIATCTNETFTIVTCTIANAKKFCNVLLFQKVRGQVWCTLVKVDQG